MPEKVVFSFIATLRFMIKYKVIVPLTGSDCFKQPAKLFCALTRMDWLKHSDKGFKYWWELNYKGKFIRTLWMVPVTVITIIILIITDLPAHTTMIMSVLFIITLIIQLIYTYTKWKKEPYS